jgi:hypothetical protein
MEPLKLQKPLKSSGEGQPSPPRQQEKPRRFRIVKLEERIAPKTGGEGSHHTCTCNVFTHGCC